MKFVSKNGIVLKGFCNHKPVEKGFYVSKFQINIDVCPPKKRCVLFTCHENKQTHTHSKKNNYEFVQKMPNMNIDICTNSFLGPKKAKLRYVKIYI